MGEWECINAANWLYYINDPQGARWPYGYALRRHSDGLEDPVWDAIVFDWTDVSTTIRKGVSLKVAKVAIEQRASSA